MKKIKKIIFTILCALHFFSYINALQKAVICVPIADLTGEKMENIYSSNDTDQACRNLPVCGGKNAAYACPRLHQLLYNDVVEIISTKNDGVCVRITNAYYLTPSSTKKNTTYWTSNKNIRYLDELVEKKINIQHIPEAINFNTPCSTHNTHVATLIMPHDDNSTHYTFSAGTRFILQKPLKKKCPRLITVFAIDYTKNKNITIKLPSHKCLFSSDLTTPEQQINRYVELLKQWAHQNDSFIPYVWGGTSFTTTINTPFKEVTAQNDHHAYSWYEFDKDTMCPKNGFDCSGVIVRAAQTCGIPYFCKNTTTIGQSLAPLQPDETLMNGDIILIRGHVMVVSDIEKNLLIEARGYTHGYGKLHEIALDKVFDGIDNYHALCDAFVNKKRLKRKDINGNIRDQFDDWKILKIMSVYNT